jgi:hypothetical protein
MVSLDSVWKHFLKEGVQSRSVSGERQVFHERGDSHQELMNHFTSNQLNYIWLCTTLRVTLTSGGNFAWYPLRSKPQWTEREKTPCDRLSRTWGRMFEFHLAFSYQPPTCGQQHSNPFNTSERRQSTSVSVVFFLCTKQRNDYLNSSLVYLLSRSTITLVVSVSW